MKKIAVLSMVLLLMGFAVAANATPAKFYFVNSINEFDAENLRINGLPSIVENFEGGLINTPGLTITDVGGAGTYALGTYENIVNAPGRYQNFNYTSMNGFGGWFDLTPGGAGSSIDVYVGVDYVGNIANTFSGQFWGFFSNIGVFNSVTFVEGNAPGVQETYQIVDLAICPVPIPGSLVLLGSGILGMVGIGIRRKSA